MVFLLASSVFPVMESISLQLFFVFGQEGVFFGGFQHPPFGGGSTACCDLGVLAGRDEQTSFYSTVLPSLLTAPPHLVSS